MLMLDNAIVQHYSSMLFKDDASRIIYSSTERCFRERAKAFEGQLNVPFMNMYRTNIRTQEGNASWKNKSMTIRGIFIPELGMNVRALPVTVNYEANVFYGQRAEDTFIGMGLALQDDAYETRLPFHLPVDNTELQLKNIGVLHYRTEFDNLYTDNDFFEKNRLRSIQLDFSLDTFLLLDMGADISITEKAILNLATVRNIETVDMTTAEVYELILQGEDIVLTEP